MRALPKATGLMQSRQRPRLRPERPQALRSWPVCAVSVGPPLADPKRQAGCHWEVALEGLQEWGSGGAGLVCPEGSCAARTSVTSAAAEALGVPGRGSDPVFCQGWGGTAQGSHSPSPFRPRFSAPHPFHLFCCRSCFWKGFFVWLVFWIFLFFRFVSSFVSPGFVLDVDAVFCP